MIFRVLVMIIQLMSAAFLFYLVITHMQKKQRQLKREEVLDEHNEKLKDKQLQQQLRGGKNNEQK